MREELTDHNISFRLPSSVFGQTMRITLKPWSEGLKPLSMDEYLGASGESIKQTFNSIWEYRLSEISSQIDPVSWQLWVSEIPEDIYNAIIRHGLDNIATLYLLCQINDLRSALSNGCFLNGLVDAWMRDNQLHGMKYAMELINKKLSIKRCDALGLFSESIIEEVSPLRIKFLGYIPASYRFIRDVSGPLYLDNFDEFLPHFFSCRRRFKEKLMVLNAFYTACRYASIPYRYVAPLFSRVIRHHNRVRVNNLTLLFIRLKAAFEVLKKKNIYGILQGSPSIRFLEKYVRRLEIKIERQHFLVNICGPKPQDYRVTDLPLVSFIEPILCRNDLEMEGCQMSNCIATFDEEIRQGNSAAFRVSWPERLTLLLTKELDEWKIDDVREFDNKIPSEKVKNVIKDWLSGSISIDLSQRIPSIDQIIRISNLKSWSYLSEIVRWNSLVNDQSQYDQDIDEETLFGNAPDPLFEDQLGSKLKQTKLYKRFLPEYIDGWKRISASQELSVVGFDQDTLLSEHVKNIENEEKCIYIHPALILGYVLVNDASQPYLSMEVISHHDLKCQGVISQGENLVEMLRTKLYWYSDEFFSFYN